MSRAIRDQFDDAEVDFEAFRIDSDEANELLGGFGAAGKLNAPVIISDDILYTPNNLNAMILEVRNICRKARNAAKKREKEDELPDEWDLEQG